MLLRRFLPTLISRRSLSTLTSNLHANTAPLRVAVYCASSSAVSPVYLETAFRVGKHLAAAGHTVIYGGGGKGLMGRVADGVVESGGAIIGVTPRFMKELEWVHPRVEMMKVTETMHARKEMMLAESQAVVALPGGSGTLDELIECITMKRLGLFLGPIVIVNVDNFYEHLLKQLERCIDEKFMDHRHRGMWSVVSDSEGVISALKEAPEWSEEARKFATQ